MDTFEELCDRIRNAAGNNNDDRVASSSSSSSSDLILSPLNDEQAETVGNCLLDAGSSVVITELSIDLDELTEEGNYESLLKFISTCPVLGKVTFFRGDLDDENDNISALIVSRFLQAVVSNRNTFSLILKDGLNVSDTDLTVLLRHTQSIRHLELISCPIVVGHLNDGTNHHHHHEELVERAESLAQAFGENTTLKCLILGNVNDPFLLMILFQLQTHASLTSLEIRFIPALSRVHVAYAIQQVLSSPWTCRLETLILHGFNFRQQSLQCIMAGVEYQSNYYPILQRKLQPQQSAPKSSCHVLRNLIFRNCMFMDDIPEYLDIFEQNFNLQMVRVINSGPGGMSINPDRRALFPHADDKAKLEWICTRNTQLAKLLQGNHEDDWKLSSPDFLKLLPRLSKIVLSTLSSSSEHESSNDKQLNTAGIQLVYHMLLSTGDLNHLSP